MENQERQLTEMLQGMQENLNRMEKKQRMAVKKKLSKRKMAGVLTMLAMVLMVAGTYAWNNFNQRALNPLSEVTNHGGRIHNHYHIADGELASGTHVKRIFGENFGSSRLFVRIRMREFLTVGVDSAGNPVPIGVGPLGTPPVADNPDSWVIYTVAEGNDVHERAGESALIGEQEIGRAHV